MGKSKRKREGVTPVKTEPGTGEQASRPLNRRVIIIVASVVIVAILAIVGFFYYKEYIEPYRRTIITIDGTTIDVGYFLKRAKASGSTGMGMLASLTNEHLIKIEAPQYVGEVTVEDIDKQLRANAGENITDSEFKEWYRQRLNESGLSDAEYREIIAASILTSRFREYLAENVPTVAEQVHVYGIILGNYEDAEKAKIRLDAGEDFNAIVREVSLDEASKASGGEMGWFPRGVLPYQLDTAAFSLGTDNVSDPIPYSSDPQAEEVEIYYILKVPEKAEARDIDENSLQTLKNTALQDWLNKEIAAHDIKYNYNSEIDAWINWQLSKGKASTS